MLNGTVERFLCRMLLASSWSSLPPFANLQAIPYPHTERIRHRSSVTCSMRRGLLRRYDSNLCGCQHVRLANSGAQTHPRVSLFVSNNLVLHDHTRLP